MEGIASVCCKALAKCSAHEICDRTNQLLA